MAADAIAPIETGVAAFVGRTSRGAPGVAVEVRASGDVERLLGPPDPEYPVVASLGDFFANGGEHAFVVSVGAPGGTTVSAADLVDDRSARSGLYALDAVEFDLLIVPPDAPGADPTSGLLAAAARYCVERRAFLICDPPAAWEAAARAGELDALAAQSLGISPDADDHAAVYFPALRRAATDDGAAGPPSGAIAGCLARNDRARGIWAAPAGAEMTLAGTRTPTVALDDRAMRLLNRNGVNVLRMLPDGSTAIWGGRTIRAAPRDPYRYVPVRRFALYLERSIERGTQWAQFEPNAEPLWARVRTAVSDFLMTTGVARLWPRPKMGFFVRCDGTAMTQNDIDNGRLVIEVGIAPLKPAEFVVIRIEQLVGAPSEHGRHRQ